MRYHKSPHPISRTHKPPHLTLEEWQPSPVPEPWQDLLTTGAAFLQALSTNVSPPLFETDKNTGRSYLKIPLPDKKIIQSALPAINSLVDTLKGLVK